MILKKTKCTEDHLKEAAKKLFFVDGNLHATTQEIADAAGVNRTLLNYYFRSRDELFRQVFIEARKTISDKLDELFGADLPFKEKVANFVDEFSEMVYQAPYSEIFLVSEINDLNKPFPMSKNQDRKVYSFLEEIKLEMERGTIVKMEPLNFLMNMFALVSHPILMKPLYISMYELGREDFESLIKSRKKIITELLLTQGCK